MERKLKQTRTKFTIWIVLFAVLSVFSLGFFLYQSNIIKFSSDINSQQLSTLIEDDPAVVEYLETQKDFEAHFITIANLIKDDQQQQLGEIFVFITVPILLIVAIIGYLVAKRLLKPVEDAYQAQERFIQDAAHELRNPLATMSAVVQNAKRIKTASSKQYQELIRQMERQIKRLVRINEDLLYLDRQIDSTNSLNNISELTLDVIEDVQPAARAKNLKIESSIESDIELRIEAKEYIRLLKNILDNAIKYSKNSSTNIKVTLNKNGKHIELIVKDSGIGIPKEDLNKIGERFFRASNAAKHDGTGLGISIVNKIANEYNADIELISIKSKGTTFIVRF